MVKWRWVKDHSDNKKGNLRLPFYLLLFTVKQHAQTE